MNKGYSLEVWYQLLLMVVLDCRSFILARRIYRYTGVNLIRKGQKGYQSLPPKMVERLVSFLAYNITNSAK